MYIYVYILADIDGDLFLIGRGSLINTDNMPIHICTHVRIYMYIYIYIGRHRWRPLPDQARLIDQLGQHACTYIHTRMRVHICTHICIYIGRHRRRPLPDRARLIDQLGQHAPLASPARYGVRHRALCYPPSIQK